MSRSVGRGQVVLNVRSLAWRRRRLNGPPRGGFLETAGRCQDGGGRGRVSVRGGRCRDGRRRPVGLHEAVEAVALLLVELRWTGRVTIEF